ncbi:MAG: pyridoxamine 5'-phosphate oxidase-related FMN-binding protein [Bacteroidetes bacterium]|jgi:uncharacterized pyridoxamine 5'-phosphate oxidase family protein|nr:pyridoxamine 5'-phosphate oxidase-related FMN-binding protein [Bacteroidota bacterium]
MNIDDCIRFANENPVCHVATAVDNQPYVRILGMWFADKTGFYFQSGSIKELPGQLAVNPKTELCFYHHEGITGTMLRVQGEAEILDDQVFKNKVVEDRPFLKTLGLTAESPDLFLFRIAHGKAHFWTMANNLKAKAYINF